jgi:signal transduction histidine kinase
MSLFLKVFLWFWLAAALVIVAFFLANELTHTDDGFPRDSLIDGYTVFIGVEAAGVYEREGRAGLAAHLGRIESETGVRVRLFDEAGEELAGLGAQAGAGELISRAGSRAGADAPFRQRHGGRHLVGFKISTDAGRRYWFVVRPGPRGAHAARHVWALLPRVLAVVLTAGLLCYLLARYIVSPVVKLRAATRRLAGGDLSARVGPLLGGRRDELADMAQDFDLMAAQIESLMSAQGRLLRDISHELRSPLARLGVALDLARKRAGGEASGALARIEREAVRLNEMIGQLLSLSRWETGADAARRAHVNLSALVGEVAEDADFEARAQDRAVEIVEREECAMEGTRALLRSAFENVVRNAVRHAPPGTGVRISLRREGGEAVLGVRDEGAGVPEEALRDIFRPFYRVDDSRTRETGGTGLGLAITERAVRLHGGTVAASNVPGGGFVVEIRLPLDAESKAPDAR